MWVWDVGRAAFFGAAIVAAGCSGGGQIPGTPGPQNPSFGATASEPLTIAGSLTTIPFPSSGATLAR